MRFSAAIASGLLLVTGACGSPGGGRNGATPAPTRPRSTAALRIAEPAQGATLPTGQVRMRVELDGARIVPQTSKKLRPDEGHLHVNLDGKLVSMNYGLEQDVLVEEKGNHLLQAEFVAADHVPFSPRVLAATTFSTQ